MKKLKIIFGALALTLSISVSAQLDAKIESKRLMTLNQKLEGTFQIQVIDSREKVAFPLSALDSIENKRQQNQTIYFWLKNNIRVMVPPYTTINKKGFVPLERTKYFSSRNLPQ